MSHIPCAVESALRAYHKKQDHSEYIKGCFARDIEDELKMIEKAVNSIKNVLRGYDYDGYDLSQYAKECIGETVGAL